MNLINLDKVTSTQTFLLEKDKELSLPEFTVAYTENQTQGKGQGTHVWESEEGKNISFSLLLRPFFLDPSMQYLITQIVSLAIVDTLRLYIKHGVRIKWPNDIYVNNNKICGMLIQNKLLGSSFAGVYCGIGINVNQTNFILAPNPTSICIETGKEVDKKEVFNATITNIKKRYTQLKHENIKSLQEEYLSLLLYRNEWKWYEYKGEKIKAKIMNVNEFGHLIFEKEDGEVLSCELKEWKFLF